MKYILIILTLFTALVPTIISYVESRRLFKAAQSVKPKKKHFIAFCSWGISIIFIIGVFICTVYIQWIEDKKDITIQNQVKNDKIKMQSNFDKVVSQLKTDTSLLNQTNKSLQETKEHLRSKLDSNSIEFADKISKAGRTLIKEIDQTSEKIHNQISDEKRYLYFYFDEGDNVYEGTIVNKYSAPVFINTMYITNYDGFLPCISKKGDSTIYIDRDCFQRNTTYINSNSLDQQLIPITSGETQYPQIKLDSKPGRYRFEIQFNTRNNIYKEFLICIVNINGKVDQCAQIVSYDKNNKVKIIKTYVSTNSNFNKTIQWVQEFPNRDSKRKFM